MKPTQKLATPSNAKPTYEDWLEFFAPRILGRDYAERDVEAHLAPNRLYVVGSIHPRIVAPEDRTITEERDISSLGLRFVVAQERTALDLRVAFTVFRPMMPPPQDLSADSPTGPCWAMERVEASVNAAEVPTSLEWQPISALDERLAARTAEIRNRHSEDPDRYRTANGREDRIPPLVPGSTPQQALSHLGYDWKPEWAPRVVARKIRVDEAWMLEVLLTNALQVPFAARNQPIDRAFYDCELEIRSPSPILALPASGFSQWDSRVSVSINAAGINCGADDSKVGEGILRTQTIPISVRRKIGHRTALPVTGGEFPTLSILGQASAVSALEPVQRSLAAFAAYVKQTFPQFDAGALFQEEQAFATGIAAIRSDPNVAAAFQLVNKSFDRANRFPAWRPFQLVGLVTECARLATGSPDAPVTVLQMSTGGGKTELYLAISLLWAFYARIRGERDGCVAWATFPLRLLSLQQAERFLVVLSAANEELAQASQIPGGAKEVPFSVGYYAGEQNSANEIWTGAIAAELEDQPTQLIPRLVEAAAENGYPPTRHVSGPLPIGLSRLKQNQKVVHCPRCLRDGRKSQVRTALDTAGGRFTHVCTHSPCGYRLPLHVSDAEVLRFQPTLVVGTLDKLARLTSHQDHLLLYGFARARCPTHGYCLRPNVRCNVLGCAQRTLPVESPPKPPRLLIQDELHLVDKEFGALAAPYERLRQRVLEAANGRQVRIICSTATITGYEKHIRELYGRTDVERIPAPGPKPDESFHQIATGGPHRAFLGLMPTKQTTQRVIERLTELHLRWAANKVNQGGFAAIRDQATALVYCLNKGNLQKHKAQVLNEVNRQALPPFAIDPVRLERIIELSGDSDAEQVATALSRLEDPTADQYVRLLYATSMISHGVDLETLNVMIVDGVPNSVSEHIQATSRVGRGSQVGVIACVYDRLSLRESSLYPYHTLHHQFLEGRVPPTNAEGNSKEAWRIAARGFLLFKAHEDAARRAAPKPRRQEAGTYLRNNQQRLVEELQAFSEGRLTQAEATSIIQESIGALQSPDGGAKPPFIVLRLLTSLRDLPEGIAIYPVVPYDR